MMSAVEPSLTEAVELVAGDVRRTTSLTPAVEDDDWMRQEGFASAMFGFEGVGGQRGVSVEILASLAERLVRLADVVQDEVADELWGAWPECRLHPASHPLDPRNQEDRAVWVCPNTGQAVAEIGRLGFDAGVEPRE
jgi:hypothetical protein